MVVLCCISAHKQYKLLLLLILLWSCIQFQNPVEGRTLSKLLEFAQMRPGIEKKAVVRSLIGSRPPRCERRCITCGHCEAIQVPVSPDDRSATEKILKTNAYYGGDYSSNYKAMNWKCKCGNKILNP